MPPSPSWRISCLSHCLLGKDFKLCNLPNGYMQDLSLGKGGILSQNTLCALSLSKRRIWNTLTAEVIKMELSVHIEKDVKK